jgi:hypothetical protein
MPPRRKAFRRAAFGVQAYKGRGEEYRLFWPKKEEFVRMAARFDATIVPFAAIGSDDGINMLLGPQEVTQLPLVGPLIQQRARDTLPQARQCAPAPPAAPPKPAVVFWGEIFPFRGKHACTHTHTHTHGHTNIHIHVRTRTHTHAHACVRAHNQDMHRQRMQACASVCSNACAEMSASGGVASVPGRTCFHTCKDGRACIMLRADRRAGA